MAILATAFASIEVTASDGSKSAVALSRIDVDSDGSPVDPRTALSSIEVVGNAPLGLSATGDRLSADMEVVYDDVVAGFIGKVATSGAEVVLSPEGPSWSFEVPGYAGSERTGDEVVGPLGRIMTHGGASPVVVDIRNHVRFDGIANRVVLPLVTGGRLVTLTEPLIGTRPVPLLGTGFLARFRAVEIDYKKPAGVALHHGQIIIDELPLAGVPPERILIDPEAGFPLEALHELLCEEAVPDCQEIALSMGHRLAETPGGDIVLRHLAPVDEPPVAIISLDIAELGEIDANLTPASPVPRECFRVLGSRPRPPAEGDGLVTDTVMESETKALFSKPRAQWFQQLTGSISAVPGSTGFLPEALTIVEQVFFTRVFREGCLVQTLRVTWRWKNPEVPRYTTESPATIDGEPVSYRFPDVFFFDETQPVKDDEALSFAFPSPLFMPIKIEQVDYFRDEFLAISAPQGPSNPDTGEPIGWRGRTLKEIRSEGVWRLDETPLKFRSSLSTAWEDANFRSAIPLRGNRQPVEGPETLFVGPQNPDRPSAGGSYPSSGFLGVPFGVVSMAEFTRPFWSSVETVRLQAFDPEQAHVHMSQAQLQSARDIAKPGTFLGVDFADNVLIDQLLDRLDLFGAGALAEIRVTPERPGGFLSSSEEIDQGWSRRPPTGADTNFQWANGEMTATASIIGRVQGTESHNYIPDGDSHADLVSITDAEGQPLPSTSTTGNAGHSPIADVCMPELDALESQPIEGLCCNFANLTLVEGIRDIPIEFGIESTEAATDLACVMMRNETAAIAQISLPNIVSILYSGAPIHLIAARKGIDPAVYAATGSPPHLSNAWVLDVAYRTAQDDMGDVRKTTALTVKVPTF